MTLLPFLSRRVRHMRRFFLMLSVWVAPAAFAAGPEDELAAVVKTYLGGSLTPDWQGIEKLPGIQWAPLPPAMLQNCLPNGDCFARQGRLVAGGRTLTVMATGA